jgi:hypothetical protein
MTFRRSCPTSLPERVTPASSDTSRTLSFAKIVTGPARCRRRAFGASDVTNSIPGIYERSPALARR